PAGSRCRCWAGSVARRRRCETPPSLETGRRNSCPRLPASGRLGARTTPSRAAHPGASRYPGVSRTGPDGRLREMSALTDTLAARTSLTDAQVEHITRLVGESQLLADLAFADLLLWVPIALPSAE